MNEIAFTMLPESLHHLLLIADGVVNELHRGFLHLGPDLGTVCIFNIIGDMRCIQLQISTSAGLCAI